MIGGFLPWIAGQTIPVTLSRLRAPVLFIGGAALGIAIGTLMLAAWGVTEGLTGPALGFRVSFEIELKRFWLALGASGFAAGAAYWWLTERVFETLLAAADHRELRSRCSRCER